MGARSLVDAVEGIAHVDAKPSVVDGIAQPPLHLATDQQTGRLTEVISHHALHLPLNAPSHHRRRPVKRPPELLVGEMEMLPVDRTPHFRLYPALSPLFPFEYPTKKLRVEKYPRAEIAVAVRLPGNIEMLHRAVKYIALRDDVDIFRRLGIILYADHGGVIESDRALDILSQRRSRQIPSALRVAEFREFAHHFGILLHRLRLMLLHAQIETIFHLPDAILGIKEFELGQKARLAPRTHPLPFAGVVDKSHVGSAGDHAVEII